MVKYRFNR